MPFLISLFSLLLFCQRTRPSSSSSSAASGVVAVVLVVLFIVFIILLIVVIAIITHKRQQKRIQAFQAFAAQNGWAFVPNVTVDYFQNSSSYSLLNAGHSKRVLALIQRPLDDGHAFIFDY